MKLNNQRNATPESTNSRPLHLAAFTLIELLAVIAVIIVLMGILIQVTGYVHRLSMESRIKIEIKAMEAALEAYKADFGDYPPIGNIGGTSRKDLLDDNINSNWLPPTPNITTHSFDWVGCWDNSKYIYAAIGTTNNPMMKVYMKFNPKYLFPLGGGEYRILDPLGNPYGYYPSGSTKSTKKPSANPGTFDLFSSGFDNKTDYPNIQQNTDDVGNWQ